LPPSGESFGIHSKLTFGPLCPGHPDEPCLPSSPYTEMMETLAMNKNNDLEKLRKNIYSSSYQVLVYIPDSYILIF